MWGRKDQTFFQLIFQHHGPPSCQRVKEEGAGYWDEYVGAWQHA
jgi:hypothetical protein